MKPKENISRKEVAFGPEKMTDYLPPAHKIPKEFFSDSNKWSRYIQGWFYGGLKESPIAKDGVNFKDAAAHISVILASFEPKHEHKIAGCAYLASQWFKDEMLSKATGE
ncbi:hypothetical protein [Dryocola sp. BD626]|uniref:hypothetical protein n=1 Tax=Dryocola sp. BD626 TaxID=3133273 RepID=UPI003F508AE5